MNQKILDAYRYKKLDNFLAGVAGVGLAALVVSAIVDSTPLSIGGASIMGIAAYADIENYIRAYLEATLDYKAHGRFTKLED